MAARGEVSNIEARAKRKADEFIAKVQADAAIKTAAERDVRELERELVEAKKEAERPRSRKEIEAELMPIQAQLLACQKIFDEGARRRPTAKPLVQVEEAKKVLPTVKKEVSLAKRNTSEIESELDGLGWWRWMRKRELVAELPAAKLKAAELAKRLEAVGALAGATPVETIDAVVGMHREIEAELEPQCRALQAQLSEIQAKEAALQAREAALQAARDAEDAKAREMQQEAEKAAQKAEYDRLVAETRAYRAANPNWRREMGVQERAPSRSDDYDSPGLG
jgi:Skp family chaperone for outer membrane proteins